MSKLPGKTTYSGIRRSTTRKSGFKSHPDATGGEYKCDRAKGHIVIAGTPLKITFTIPTANKNVYAGFGGFFISEHPIELKIINPNTSKNSIETYAFPNISKFGSMWNANENVQPIEVTFTSTKDTTLYLYGIECGLIWHEAFDTAISNGQTSYLENMHSIMPEAAFYIEPGAYTIKGSKTSDQETPIHLKSCNRCARFLPINIDNERAPLSFSNHCIANAPCKHGGFGLLTNIETGGEIKLHFGFQLECRFCKKYFVNMPLNWQRTAAQMKEDGQRRRNFELLIAEIYQSSPQLSYRIKTGKELLDDTWDRFSGQCFKCSNPLASKRKMHLDHTRPLALLWPLDETATALCAYCNGRKRDKNPSEFYTNEQLVRLAQITGLSVHALTLPEPNHDVIKVILERIDWLYDTFLTKPELLKERDGKITAELVVKALDKVLRRSHTHTYNFSFVEEYNRRRDLHIAYDDNEDFSSII